MRKPVPSIGSNVAADLPTAWTAAQATMKRLLRDDSGQDLVEYGLLSALVGVAAVLIWQQLVTTVGTTYGQANTNVQTLSTCTPDPGGGGC